MAEPRPITYTSLGFKLGLKGSRSLPASGTAANSLLDTLLSSVPSAKALLPKVAPELSKPKPATDRNVASGDNQGLSGSTSKQPVAPDAQPKPGGPSPKPDQPQQELRAATQAGQVTAGTEQRPAGPNSAADVISLVSDSDEEVKDASPAALDLTAATATTTAQQPETCETAVGSARPVSAEYIPLPKAEAKEAGPPKGAAPGSADALAEDEEIRRRGKRPYWMSYVASIDSPLLRLHQELIELCELVQPTPEEAAARKEAVAVVSEVVRSIWPNARCEIFGSYATGLYVPTSDIDLVILDSGCSNVQSGLKALATALSQRQIGRSIQVIGKARVPIVKFETVDFGNLAFDVSFDVANGPQAALLVGEMTASWPMMRPLILCLKLFLQQRELNEVYTGGIGSYALITLVAAFLQLHASRRQKSVAGDAAGGSESAGKRGRGSAAGAGGSQLQAQQRTQPLPGTAGAAAKSSLSGVVEPGLGVLLVDFFRFYGRVVNLPEVGISCAAGGQFFRKVDKDTPSGPHNFKGWLNMDRSYLLAVEDPKDPDNDVCRSSFNIMKVKTAFEYAYQMLTAPSQRHESLLARILRLGPILASRPRPSVDHLRELGYYCEPPERREQARKDRREERNERKKQAAAEAAAAQAQGQGQGQDKAEAPQEQKAADRKGGKGGGGGGKKRTRESDPSGGESSGKRPKSAGREGKKSRRRESTPGKGTSGKGPNSGSGGKAQKRRRGEDSPAAEGGDSAPRNSNKRARKEGRRSSQGGAGTSGRQRDSGAGHDRHPPPPQQRRPALMHVSTVPPPAPAPVLPPPVAPIFHPGYMPPSEPRHHGHHHSRQHESSRHRHGVGGARGGSRSHHHSRHDDRGGYGGGGGGSGSGQGQGQGRRAPLMVPQQYAPPQQLRGSQHNHNGQRKHTILE